MRKWIIALGQFTITLACFWLVIEGIDFKSAWTLMSGLSPWLLALLFALIFTQIGLIAWRLQFVVNAIGQTTTFVACFHTVMSGAFVGQTPVSTLGADAARIWYLLRGGLSLREAAGAVFIDRVVGLVALVLMVALADIPLFMLVQDFWMRVAIVLVTLGSVCGLAALLLLQRLPQRAQRVHVVRWMSELSRLLSTVLRQWHFGPLILLLGIVGHLTSVLVLYALFAAFGAPQLLGDCLILTPFPAAEPVVILWRLGRARGHSRRRFLARRRRARADADRLDHVRTDLARRQPARQHYSSQRHDHALGSLSLLLPLSRQMLRERDQRSPATTRACGGCLITMS
jgi:hypothetical protein